MVLRNFYETPCIAAEEEKKGYVPDAYRVYLPKKLDLDTHIRKHPLPSDLLCQKKPHYVMDNVKFVLGSIYEVFAGNKDINPITTLGYANLCSTPLQRTVADYNKILDWAVSSKILETDGSWQEGMKCTGYRFNPKYGYKLKAYDLYKPEITKVKLKGVCKKTTDKFPKLWKYHQQLEINLEEVDTVLKSIRETTVKDVLEKMNNRKNKHLYRDWTPKEKYKEAKKIAQQKERSRYIAAEKVSKQVWHFSQDDNIERLHTNVTGLKRELRPLLRNGGQQLIGVDLVNSQPAISCVLFDINCWEKLNLTKQILKYNKVLRKSKFHTTQFKYTPIILQDLRRGIISQDILNYRRAALEGRIYEQMMETYEKVNGKPISRDEIKKLFLSILFTPTKYNMKNKLYIAMRKEYPNVFAMFEWINTGFEKFKNGIGQKPNSTKGHYARGEDDQSSALALLLQNLETQLILDKIIPLIIKDEPEMPLHTIHDSIVTTKGNEIKVELYMLKGAYQLFGYSPKIKIEYDKW